MLTKSSCPLSLQNTPDVPMCHQPRFFDRQVGRNIPLDVNPNLIGMNPASSFASRPMALKGGGRRRNNTSRRRSSRNTKPKKYAKRTWSNTTRCDKKTRGGDAPAQPQVVPPLEEKLCYKCNRNKSRNTSLGKKCSFGDHCEQCVSNLQSTNR